MRTDKDYSSEITNIVRKIMNKEELSEEDLDICNKYYQQLPKIKVTKQPDGSFLFQSSEPVVLLQDKLIRTKFCAGVNVTLK